MPSLDKKIYHIGCKFFLYRRFLELQYQLKFLNFQKWDAKKYSKMYHMTFMHINHKYYIKRLFNCHICHHFGVTLKLDMGVKDLPPCFPACWWEPHGPVDRTPSFSGNLDLFDQRLLDKGTWGWHCQGLGAPHSGGQWVSFWLLNLSSVTLSPAAEQTKAICLCSLRHWVSVF